MKLAILGAAGSGKGQNTSRIAKKYNLHHVVVGDIVKAEIRNKTEVGKIMYDFTSKGRFVPSDIVMDVLAKQLNTFPEDEGFIIDTAPLNMDQYNKMVSLVNLDAVISLEVENYNILRHRTLNRLICPSCRGVTSVTESPDEVCPYCGEKLEHRYDDNLETVNFRIAQYLRETVPVLDEFEKQGKLIRINAELSKEEVFSQICQKIDNFFAKKSLK
ncbi:MAG: nucleoside monophosphate kinase [Clostridia bacterium]|nr:nucleoside monophosphate kinase [Clostridia bacterium]